MNYWEIFFYKMYFCGNNNIYGYVYIFFNCVWYLFVWKVLVGVSVFIINMVYM